jgi:hypothetical protein
LIKSAIIFIWVAGKYAKSLRQIEWAQACGMLARSDSKGGVGKGAGAKMVWMRAAR